MMLAILAWLLGRMALEPLLALLGLAGAGGAAWGARDIREARKVRRAREMVRRVDVEEELRLRRESRPDAHDPGPPEKSTNREVEGWRNDML